MFLFPLDSLIYKEKSVSPKNKNTVVHSDIDTFLNESITALIKYFLHYSLWTQVHVFK